MAKNATLRDLQADEADRLAFQNVFAPRENRADAAWVYAQIMLRCGRYCTEASDVRPELIAFATWLDEQIGIKHRSDAHQMLREAEAMIEIADSSDLLERRKRELRRTGGDEIDGRAVDRT